MVDVSIIIVSWNVREYLARCLESIARVAGDISLEVFVVDNGSTDDTREWLLNYELGIRNNGRHPFHNSLFLIHNSTNAGFAAANNQAMRQAKGKYILLLNPDTELRPHLNPLLRGEEAGRDPLLLGEGSSPRNNAQLCYRGVRSPLQTMLHFMDSHPRCGILGPKLLNGDGTLQPSVQRFPDAWSPILFSLGMRPKKYLALDFGYTKAQIVDQVMGACFLIRREMMDTIGLLDERFFIWFEEVDYCKRAEAAGWEVWYTPDVLVVHHGGTGFAQIATPRKQWWYAKSLLYYFRKHRQWGAYSINAATIPFRLIFSLFQ